MKITNNHHLPKPLYQAIVAQGQAHSVGEAEISCTQLIDSPLIRWLWRTYEDEIEEDATDRLWALYGSIAHKLLETYEGKGQHVETEAIATIDGIRISGHIDLLLFPDGTMQDYKFTSAWGVSAAKKSGKIEWERQLNVYRFLLQHDPNRDFPQINHLQIVAMLRDYGPRHAPELKPVEIIDIPVWPDEQIEAYLRDRVRLHREAITGVAVPPQCTADER